MFKKLFKRLNYILSISHFLWVFNRHFTMYPPKIHRRNCALFLYRRAEQQFEIDKIVLHLTFSAKTNTLVENEGE